MNNLFLTIIRERIRRYRHFVINKPITAGGFVITACSFFYMLINALLHSFCFSEYLDYPIVIFVIMVYLIAKIINSTQGMTIDYQLLELKLLTFWQFKIMIGIKLFGGSVLLSLVCLNSYTEKVAIVSILNAMVNVWIFLRNRWNSRMYDFFVTCAIVICIRFQFCFLAIVCGGIMFFIYVMIKRVDYENLLPLYRFMYKATQQRYMGVGYSAKEAKDIEVSAERLIGMPKQKNSGWCEKLYEKRMRFEIGKEMARISANFNKLIAYFIICIMFGMSKFYIPSGYDYMIFIMIALIPVSFDFMMNRAEVNLLLRGFINKYVVSSIVRNKVPIYSMVNFVLMLPSAMLGWKWLILAAICSILIAFASLYKCFYKH